MSSLTSIIVFAIIFLLFLAMAVVGIARPKIWGSGPMTRLGILGASIVLLVAVYNPEALLKPMRQAGIIDYDLYTDLYKGIHTFAFLLPILILLVLGIIERTMPNLPNRRTFVLFGYILTIFMFLFVAFTLPSQYDSPVKHDEHIITANLIKIQSAVEKYISDKNQCPDSIDSLISSGYLPQLPANPFTNQPMKEIPYGSPDYTGNFTYLPIYDQGIIYGYFLIAYGYKDSTGNRLMDPNTEDHAIIVFKSENLQNSDIKQALQSSMSPP